MTDYAGRFPDLYKLTDEDGETGYKAFEIATRRFSFRLTAPYSEEQRKAASEWTKKNGVNKL